jgi:molybdenum cofactor biosynthesis enzyme MoaA
MWFNPTCVTGTYCMPADGVDLQPQDNMLSDDEVLKIAQLFVSEGVNKIRLTGGEPTVRKGIGELIGEISPPSLPLG